MPSRQHVNAISAGCVSLPSSSVSCVQAVCAGRCMSVAALCIAHHRARQVSCMLHVACDIKRRLLHVVACAALHVTFCVQCSMRTARCRRCPRSLGSGRTHSVADRYDVVRRVQYDRYTLYAVGQVYFVCSGTGVRCMQWDRCTSCSRTRSVSERADVVRAQTEPLRCNAEAAVHDRQTERTACKRQQATSNVAACDVDMQHAACNNVQLTTCSMQHAAQRATCTLSAHTVRPDCVNGRSRNRQLELVRAGAQRHLRGTPSTLSTHKYEPVHSATYAG